MRRRLVSVLLGALLAASCGPTPTPCRRDCWADCDRRELVLCDLSCPAGTSESPPAACPDAGASCERSCWSDCERAELVACDIDCPEGTLPVAPGCDAGVERRDAGRFPDSGGPVDAGPPYLPCSTVTEAQARAAAYTPDRRVPDDWFWDPPLPDGTTRDWRATCETSLATARATARAIYGEDSLTGETRSASPFWEVDVSVTPGETILVRFDRCSFLGPTGVLGQPNSSGLEVASRYVWTKERGASPTLSAAQGELEDSSTYWICEVRLEALAGECDQLGLWALSRRLDVNRYEPGVEIPVELFEGECPDP